MSATSCVTQRSSAISDVRIENDEENQKARAFMRERFLRVMTGIVGQRCDFTMYEKTNVRAELRGCDRDIMHLCVTKLETPLGVIPQSILRTGDILSIHVPEVPSFSNCK